MNISFQSACWATFPVQYLYSILQPHLEQKKNTAEQTQSFQII
jgi:hypothetical protein